MAAKWPEFVPVFMPDMICRGAYTKGEKRCASQWLGEMFDDGAARDAARETFREITGIEGTTYTIAEWNDSHSERTIARSLNEMARQLGYTEIVDA